MASELQVTSGLEVKSTGDDVPSMLILTPMACEVVSLVDGVLSAGITLATGSDKRFYIDMNEKP